MQIAGIGKLTLINHWGCKITMLRNERKGVMHNPIFGQFTPKPSNTVFQHPSSKITSEDESWLSRVRGCRSLESLAAQALYPTSRMQMCDFYTHSWQRIAKLPRKWPANPQVWHLMLLQSPLMVQLRLRRKKTASWWKQLNDQSAVFCYCRQSLYSGDPPPLPLKFT